MAVDIIKGKNGTKKCDINGNKCVHEGTTECHGCTVYAGIGASRTNKFRSV